MYVQPTPFWAWAFFLLKQVDSRENQGLEEQNIFLRTFSNHTDYLVRSFSEVFVRVALWH